MTVRFVTARPIIGPGAPGSSLAREYRRKSVMTRQAGALRAAVNLLLRSAPFGEGFLIKDGDVMGCAYAQVATFTVRYEHLVGVLARSANK